MTHALGEAAEDGHCYLPQPELIKQVVELLKTESHRPVEDAIALIIQNMALASELIREKSTEQILLCYKPSFFYTELNLAQSLQQRYTQLQQKLVQAVRLP